MVAQYQRALLLYAQHRYADAERELRQYLGEEPNSAQGYAMLALVLSHLERHTEASGEARRAIGQTPHLAFAHYALAFTLYRRNRMEEATPAIEEAIGLENGNADYLALLSAIQLDLRRWPAALDAAERGLSFDPEHVWCTNLRAMALVRLGRRTEAGATIDAALRRSPEDAHSHANQGWTLLHKGQPKEAMGHFREALRLDPTSQWARSGIIEAMKARFFVYRWLLAYFLWMARLSGRAQWGIMVGGWVGYQVLAGYAARDPAAARVIWPILIAYVVFVGLTWIAYPLFNLILRLSRFGRLALTRVQTIESNCIGVLLLAALSLFVFGKSTGAADVAVSSLVVLLLVIPVTGIFRVESGWPQIVMIVVASVMGAFGLGLVASLIAFPHMSVAQQEAFQPWIAQSISGFGWGILIVGLGRNYLAGVRVRK